MSTAREELPRLRAKFVMKRLSGWREGNERKEAVTRIKSLPVQIRAQGLTAGVAVLLREGGASAKIVALLAEWLLGGGKESAPRKTLAFSGGQATGEALLRAVVDADRPSYLAAQREALGLLDELKLLADALYGDAS